MEPDMKINLKLEPAIVFFSTVMCLSVILIVYMLLKIVQQAQFSDRMYEVINNPQHQHVDVGASYDNMRKSDVWDHDYDKMIVYVNQ